LTNLARKILLITVIACFAALVTGLTLMLHLSSIEHPEEHNCEHCPICQQIIINPAKVIIPAEPVVIYEEIILYEVDFTFEYPTAIVENRCCIPRAPPLSSPHTV